ncbi:MAG: hypothetical protein JWP24_2523 [Marmoricola sp.]|nr:hypothetical protein [Marmoricola sp.]
MRQRVSRVYRTTVALCRSKEAPRLVLVVAMVMILAQLCFRAWALLPNWFYGDDYVLMMDAGQGLGVDYLLAPFNGHLMPWPRLAIWLVTSSGTLNWFLAATLTLVVQAMADVAALWMLVTLFRARWAVLGPLSLYLFGTLTLPATMWWIASLNQMSMQVGFFLAVGAWVLYLRTSRTRWLLVTVLAVALGLTSDSKSLLILPVLVFVLVSYFAAGSPVQRVRSVLQRYWRAALAVGVPAVLYLGYYVSAVDQPFMGVGLREIGRTASAMLGRAFTTAAVGGPWGWDPVNPPNANADPPATAVQLALVVVVLVILFGALRRHRTLRAWGLLAGYLVALLALLVTSRVPAYGASIGLEYRFLTDAACVLCLCVGLAFLPVVGAHESTTPRADPLLRVRIPVPAQIGLLTIVLCSSLFSSVRYVDIWHQQNDSVTYLSNLRSDLRTYGAVDLVDQPVPEEIISPLSAPANALRQLVSLLQNRASYPLTSPRLSVVGPDGRLRQALIQPGVVSKRGPVDGCGWSVGATGATIPLTGRAFVSTWWMRIGYLANNGSPVTVTAGPDEVGTTVSPGVRSLYVRVEGSFTSVRIDGLDPGTRLCVDSIEVGQPIPGGIL